MSTGIINGGIPGGALGLTVGAPQKGADVLGGVRGLGLMGDAYTAGGYGTQELSSWHPRLQSADSEVIPSRDKIVARSRDLDRNNGWAHAAVDKRVDMVVGTKTWLRARPNFAAMGQSAEWADEWAIQVEAQFAVWANSSRFLCDVERHQHFGGMIRLAYQHYIIDGEAIAAVMMLPRGGIYETAALVIDPDRLANPDGRPDGEYLRGGVELDRYGAAIAYHIRRGHESDLSSSFDAQRFTRIPREGQTGRPLFIHVFDKRRAHMRRGVGRLASVMSRMKMLDRYDATELQQAVTNATFGLYAKTQRDSDGVRDSLSPIGDDYDASEGLDAARANFYEESDLTFDGVRVAVLPDGDSIETIEANRSGTNFAAFQRTFLNSIAGAFGISGEQLSNDWSGINYSSARTLLNEIWRGLHADRHQFTQAFATPIYTAWLEEAVARDLIAIPGGQAMFYQFRDALTQCQWIGPGRGSIDPKKEADAGEVNRAGLVSTLEMDCLEQGVDWRDVLWQAKREDVEKERYGLKPEPIVAANGTGGAGGGSNEPDPANRDEEDAAESAQSTRTAE